MAPAAPARHADHLLERMNLSMQHCDHWIDESLTSVGIAVAERRACPVTPAGRRLAWTCEACQYQIGLDPPHHWSVERCASCERMRVAHRTTTNMVQGVQLLRRMDTSTFSIRFANPDSALTDSTSRSRRGGKNHPLESHQGAHQEDATDCRVEKSCLRIPVVFRVPRSWASDDRVPPLMLRTSLRHPTQCQHGSISTRTSTFSYTANSGTRTALSESGR